MLLLEGNQGSEALAAIEGRCLTGRRSRKKYERSDTVTL